MDSSPKKSHVPKTTLVRPNVKIYVLVNHILVEESAALNVHLVIKYVGFTSAVENINAQVSATKDIAIPAMNNLSSSAVAEIRLKRFRVVVKNAQNLLVVRRYARLKVNAIIRKRIRVTLINVRRASKFVHTSFIVATNVKLNAMIWLKLRPKIQILSRQRRGKLHRNELSTKSYHIRVASIPLLWNVLADMKLQIGLATIQSRAHVEELADEN